MGSPENDRRRKGLTIMFAEKTVNHYWLCLNPLLMGMMLVSAGLALRRKL